MVTITAEAVSGYRIEITNGRHSWIADEPVDLGGDDSGPSPYELLLGSLAACTCITLTMYAGRKGIAFTSVSASYTYDRIHADDCGFCEDDADGLHRHGALPGVPRGRLRRRPAATTGRCRQEVSRPQDARAGHHLHRRGLRRLMDALEAIATTRAIRRYRDEPVTDDQLATILFAATRAPSGSNRQPFRFLVLRDGETAAAAKSLDRRGGEVASGPTSGSVTATTRAAAPIPPARRPVWRRPWITTWTTCTGCRC